MGKKIFLIQSEGLGRGEEQLGSLLMASFLRLLGENNEKPEAIIFWNTGVRLVCEGSKVLDHLRRLESQGVTILACTTCLEYLDLMDKLAVGKPTTMVKSIEAMYSGNIVTL
ncbi:MAG: sulfurtransferase-like selenium metabolism protein YedF [Dehalococcoidales bacterium]